MQYHHIIPSISKICLPPNFSLLASQIYRSFHLSVCVPLTRGFPKVQFPAHLVSVCLVLRQLEPTHVHSSCNHAPHMCAICSSHSTNIVFVMLSITGILSPTLSPNELIHREVTGVAEDNGSPDAYKWVSFISAKVDCDLELVRDSPSFPSRSFVILFSFFIVYQRAGILHYIIYHFVDSILTLSCSSSASDHKIV
ncbi:uncharacterized protein EDB93DRAFT_214430 [Suillus bovinus]|uniref:uncharacterized protein n=1 Tax=Suillus bovinus TaxID=48563 RepID=UPI001B880EEA|nr:uncharacterized protein EDB93DRAFT_214430 [Suillus bovinus]KAG2153776.1 hypothetical protein EDB93DRAFT_214430 [Suillus bovinus]